LSHLLIKYAKRAATQGIPALPVAARYDTVLGLWMLEGALIAKMPELDRATKKEDIETGEDRKGE